MLVSRVNLQVQAEPATGIRLPGTEERLHTYTL